VTKREVRFIQSVGFAMIASSQNLAGMHRRPDLTGHGTEMLAITFSKSLRMPGDLLRHAHSSPIHDQLIGFMLASDTTMQIHFIDILAIADVESMAWCSTQEHAMQ
jgi:hypothetical protein